MSPYEALVIAVGALSLAILALAALLWWLHRQSTHIQPPLKPRSIEEIARMQ